MESGGESAGSGSAQYMLPQAQGVQLGMTWRELRRVRPDVQKEHGVPTERTREGTNEYLFRKEGHEPAPGSTGGRLAVVHMRPYLGSGSADLTSTVNQIKEGWTSLLGTPPRSSIRTVPALAPFPERVYQVLMWHTADAVLKIEHTIGDTRSPGMLVTVQLPDL